MKLLPTWIVKITDYFEDIEMNDSFKQYKDIEHVHETWHHTKN